MKKFAGDIIILNMCTKNHNHMYSSRDTEWDWQNFLSFWAILCPFTTSLPPRNDLKNQTEIFVILGHFLPFHHFDNLENQNLTLKKTPGDIIVLHMCTINDNDMMYGSWDMECDRQSFFLIFDHFLHLYPPNNPKNQNFEKMKKTLGHIFILQRCTTNDNHMMYGSWDIEHDGQIFLSFWTIFSPFIPLTTQKIKILKKWK